MRSNVSTVDEIVNEVLLECRSDYVGLWSVVRRVADSLVESAKVLAVTLSVVRKLLGDGRVVAGQFSGNQFKVWEEPVEEIVSRIESEWAQLGRNPTLGEIVWFTAQSVH